MSYFDNCTEEQISLNLKYNLSPNFFIDKKEYFKKLTEKTNNSIIKAMLQFCKIPYYINSKETEKSFIKEIEKMGIIKQFYDKAASNIESDNKNKINILQNGMTFYNVEVENKKKSNIFVYCIKDEEIEDKYLCDVNNIQSIDHKAYDSEENKMNSKKKADSEKGKQLKTKSEDLNIKKIKKRNQIYNSENKSDKKDFDEKISGLKNRALSLESLVNFFFKQFNLLSLPNLIFNISDKNERIFLFRELDGAYMNENENIISYETLKFMIPFNSEKILSIKETVEEVDKSKFIVLPKSIIFIEVKKEFPKEKEIIQNKKSLKEVIEGMIEKVNYFMFIYKEIFKDLKIENIQLLLLYDQNRIENYKESIKNYILAYKDLIANYIKNYNIYFNILYIYPSIGKIALNEIKNEMGIMENNIIQLQKNQQEKDEKYNNEILQLKKDQQEKNEKYIQLQKNQQEKDEIYNNNILHLNNEIRQLKKNQQEKEEKYNNEILQLKKDQQEKEKKHNKEMDELFKEISNLKLQMEQFNNLSTNNIKKSSNGKGMMDNEIVNTNNELIQSANKENEINKIEKIEKGCENKISNIIKKEKIEEDKIYLNIYAKLGHVSLQPKEQAYLSLYYIFREKCKDKGIENSNLCSLIETHNENKKICEIFHLCFENKNVKEKIDSLKDYGFKCCNHDNCPLKSSK